MATVETENCPQKNYLNQQPHILAGAVLAPPFWGARGLRRGPVTGKIVSVMCTNLRFRHIVTKFSSQKFSYVQQKFHVCGGSKPLTGGVPPLELLHRTAVSVTECVYAGVNALVCARKWYRSSPRPRDS